MLINQNVSTAESGAKVASGTYKSTTFGSISNTFTISGLTFAPKKIWVYSQNVGSYVIAIMADIENETGYFYTNDSREDAVFNSNSGTTDCRINIYDDNEIRFTFFSGFTYSAGTYTWYAIG